MTDIALEAGVSRSTVSLVLNNKDAALGIPEATRGRVLSAASQLGYRPNETARAMVTGKNRVIVYLLQDPAQEVTARILAGALTEAEQHGYLIKLLSGDSPFSQRDIERCVELRPTGVMALYASSEITEQLQKELDRYRIPLVLLDSSFPFPGVARVLTDDIDGMWQAAEHLHQLGHRRIAFIAGPHSSNAARVREEGYRQAISRLGLPLDESNITHGDWNIQKTQEATLRLLNRKAPRPTALICADDKMALVAARTAAKIGVRVPEDLSIVGFADLEMALYANPPLTTVAQPFADLGVATVRRLLRLSRSLEEQEVLETTDILLPNRLVIRESTTLASSP